MQFNYLNDEAKVNSLDAHDVCAAALALAFIRVQKKSGQQDQCKKAQHSSGKSMTKKIGSELAIPAAAGYHL